MLYIQDFSFSQSYSMHEALLKSSSSAIKGYGAYAFASRDGVDVLIRTPEFESLLSKGNFSMIVGIDEITNIQCLKRLEEIQEDSPNFTVKAFCHNDKGSLFHPKISFFKKEDGMGSLVLGSGNLTMRGLKTNREAFTAIDLSENEYQRMESYWSSWLSESEDKLKDVNDSEVIEKAEKNIFFKRTGTGEGKASTSDSNEDISGGIILSVSEGWNYTSDNLVLVAEIPRSGSRWKQANFDVGTFKDFFGATPGNNDQRVLLRSLNSDNSLSDIEIRPSVSVISKNYRFELNAASGVPYPEIGRPIGVFIQITTRMFLYHLYMPNHPLYREISDWQSTEWTGRDDRMKRVIRRVEDLGSILNNSVFMHYKA